MAGDPSKIKFYCWALAWFEARTGCRHCTHLKSSHGYSPQACTVTLNTGDLAGSLIGDSMNLQQPNKITMTFVQWVWLKAGMGRPWWEDVAPLGNCTKAYWAQWTSCQLVDGVVYWLETPKGDKVIKQLVVPKSLWETILCELYRTIRAEHFRVA